ncbi:hypothetical protein P692DRAFT_201437682 [Suillus brevipes Sb2]|nr:hypothetical protein P692DRAFT_201437682 [Suillus brevipes Sb2]
MASETPALGRDDPVRAPSTAAQNIERHRVSQCVDEHPGKKTNANVDGGASIFYSLSFVALILMLLLVMKSILSSIACAAEEVVVGEENLHDENIMARSHSESCT